MNIREIRTTEVRVYRADVLPLEFMASGVLVSAMTSKYSFSDVTPTVAAGQLESIEFRHGVFAPEEARQVAVPILRIEARRVQVSVLGSTDDATLLFDNVVELLKGLRPEIDPELFEPLVGSREASCVVEMQLDMGRMLSPEMHSYMEEFVAPACSSRYGTPRLRSSRVAFVVDYDLNDDLDESGATLAPKEVRIEPRASTFPGEHMFFVSAPMPTRDLIEAVERLEASFAPTND